MCSNMMQVLHIPVEERQDQVSGQFDEGSMDSPLKTLKEKPKGNDHSENVERS